MNMKLLKEIIESKGVKYQYIAEKLGISKTTYYRLTHMADLPTVLIGDRRYLHRDRFFEWLDQAVDFPA